MVFFLTLAKFTNILMHIKQSLFHIIEHELLINSVRPQNITVTKDQTCFVTAKNK